MEKPNNPLLAQHANKPTKKTHPTRTQPMHFSIDPCTTISNMIESTKITINLKSKHASQLNITIFVVKV
jgi:hypothetical protein